jgi:D-glycero-D-manno-heptose 1,7-bisphosphate phosphatase
VSPEAFSPKRRWRQSGKPSAISYGPYGVTIDGFYYCPHHPEGSLTAYGHACACRKPEPGLLRQAARERAIDLSKSWMVGDILNDVEAGNRAGCHSILVDRGNETEWLTGSYRTPAVTVTSLQAAADYIAARAVGDCLNEPGIDSRTTRL